MSEVKLDGIDERYDATNNFAAKWYLNGFPKSGLHFAEQFVKAWALPMPPGQLHDIPWVGSFQHHSWSEQWQDIQVQLYNLSRCLPGHYFKGHCGHREDIEHFMWFAGFAHVFIYRDLRDVAVSQAFHVLSDNDNWNHPEKDRFKAMGFNKTLEAVIIGLNDTYPGVVHRFEAYAPWLDVDWVFKFRYEDALDDPAGMAYRIIQYGLDRIAHIFKLDLTPSPASVTETVERMVENAVTKKTEALTFRRGIAGGWREHFTSRHKKLFKQTDEHHWLVRLDYEQSANW